MEVHLTYEGNTWPTEVGIDDDASALFSSAASVSGIDPGLLQLQLPNTECIAKDASLHSLDLCSGDVLNVIGVETIETCLRILSDAYGVVGGAVLHAFRAVVAEGEIGTQKFVLLARCLAETDGSPLCEAARLCKPDVAERLLSLQIGGLQQPDCEGMLPLCVAAVKGHHALCGLLLSYGAEVDAVDGYGCTPLLHVCYALYDGRSTADFCRQLSGSSCEDTQNGNGYGQIVLEHYVGQYVGGGAGGGGGDSPRGSSGAWSVESGVDQLVRSACAVASLLLQHGADPLKRNRNGCTPMSYAVDAGCPELLQLLEK